MFLINGVDTTSLWWVESVRKS